MQGGGVSVEKKFDVGSVTVRMGRRVGGEILGDRQCDEGVRPRHRAREGTRLDRRGGKVKAVRVQTKGADEVRGVRRVRGESVVGQRLEWVRVGKARGLQRRWGQSWLRFRGKVRCGGGNRVKIGRRVCVRSRRSVAVVREGRDEFMVGMRVRRVMGLRWGKNAKRVELAG